MREKWATRATRATRAAAAAVPGGVVAAAPIAAGASEEMEGMAVARATVEVVGYAPIVRLDAARREIELCATSEAVDSYGTIFDYKASQDAFRRWMGNVREMHERKAVGRRVDVRFDDDAKKVFVTIRISRGAQDTWEKVLDGTLRGASIGASNVDWQPLVFPDDKGRTLQVATRYDLVELSLVDNPSNPDALGITFVRDAAPDLALLDRLEETEPTAKDAKDAKDAKKTLRGVETNHRARGDHREAQGRERQAISATNVWGTGMRDGSPDSAMRQQVRSGQEQDEQERGRIAGWRAAEDTSGGRDQTAVSARLHEAARAVLAGCGCAQCEAAMAALDEGTGEETEAEEQRGSRAQTSGAETSRVREAALVRALGASLRASTGRLERLDAGICDLRTAMRETVGQMSGQVSQMASAMEQAMVSSTGELGRRLERLEAQPMPGGPAARAAEKTHALHTRGAGLAGQPSAAEQYRALEALAGRIGDPQAQIAVAAELIRLQREGFGV